MNAATIQNNKIGAVIQKEIKILHSFIQQLL